ncbi:hypothetical protein BC936DRAFT_144253 [Jimgerdemannia flammicorona]|uniref:Uncharacterized protein n=1 Tax=Jimgerdemannia flammicorona TaxID=994334 RepID=A0A433DCS2_9FUNG|nr:hypothetical protein BC936DRAFT_144253 [Jimgerdemannia flammicorona]
MVSQTRENLVSKTTLYVLQIYLCASYRDTYVHLTERKKDYSVDFATDEAIQKTTQTEFVDCTILCIAHRLLTVIDYGQISWITARL